MISHPGTIVVDAGGNAATDDQDGWLLKSLEAMGCCATGIGWEEARNPDAYYHAAAGLRLKIVAPEAGGRDGTVPYVTTTTDGVRVGVAAFNITGSERTLEVVKAQFAAYARARRESDVLVVLDSAGSIRGRWLASVGDRLGVPDIVIVPTRLAGEARAKTVGATWFVSPCSDERCVGVISLQIRPHMPVFYRLSYADMDERLVPDAAVASIIATGQVSGLNEKGQRSQP